MAFKIKDDKYFPKIMFSDQVLNMYKDNPSKWWRLMEKKTEKSSMLPHGFCKFMHNILNCPPSSSSIERVFSTFGHVWSKLRNKLGVEKASKLVKIYKFLNKNENIYTQ